MHKWCVLIGSETRIFCCLKCLKCNYTINDQVVKGTVIPFCKGLTRDQLTELFIKVKYFNEKISESLEIYLENLIKNLYPDMEIITEQHSNLDGTKYVVHEARLPMEDGNGFYQARGHSSILKCMLNCLNYAVPR